MIDRKSLIIMLKYKAYRENGIASHEKKSRGGTFFRFRGKLVWFLGILNTEITGRPGNMIGL
jgi:hypothetical protein